MSLIKLALDKKAGPIMRTFSTIAKSIGNHIPGGNSEVGELVHEGLDAAKKKMAQNAKEYTHILNGRKLTAEEVGRLAPGGYAYSKLQRIGH